MAGSGVQRSVERPIAWQEPASESASPHPQPTVVIITAKGGASRWIAGVAVLTLFIGSGWVISANVPADLNNSGILPTQRGAFMRANVTAPDPEPARR